MSIVIGTVKRIAYKQPLNHFRDYIFMSVANDLDGLDTYCMAIRLSDYASLSDGLLRSTKRNVKYGNYKEIHGNSLLIRYTGVLEYGNKTTHIPFKNITAIYSIPDEYGIPDKHDTETITQITTGNERLIYFAL